MANTAIRLSEEHDTPFGRIWFSWPLLPIRFVLGVVALAVIRWFP